MLVSPVEKCSNIFWNNLQKMKKKGRIPSSDSICVLNMRCFEDMRHLLAAKTPRARLCTASELRIYN